MQYNISTRGETGSTHLGRVLSKSSKSHPLYNIKHPGRTRFYIRSYTLIMASCPNQSKCV